jgi:hypothetical protein
MADRALGDRGQDAPFHPDHGADAGVDEDQQRELRDVFAQPQLDNHLIAPNGRRAHALASSLEPGRTRRVRVEVIDSSRGLIPLVRAARP